MTLGPLQPLAEWPQFVVVKTVPRENGKTDKLPIHFNTAAAIDAHDPANWTDYTTARAVAGALGPGHGVGFVLTKAAGVWCIDIDNCATPAGWSPLALELYAQLPGTVIEVSQSGRGLHLWGRGPIPEHACKNVALGLECYSERRFIMLGSDARGEMAPSCPGVAAVVARYFPPRETAEVETPTEGPRDSWSGPADDDALIEIMMRTAPAARVFGGEHEGGVTFADLWTCNVPALARKWHSPTGDEFDRSSADASLFQRLAFFTGADQSRMRRIAERSSLRRAKWDDRADYYVPRTIAKACAQQRDVYNDGRRAASSAPTYAEAFRQLRDLGPDEIAERWVSLALPLPADEQSRLIDLVSMMTRAGPQSLKQRLQAERARVRNERFEATPDGRVVLPLPVDAMTDQAADVERIIIARAAPGEYLTFGGRLCHVVAKPLPYSRALNGDDAPPVPRIEQLNDVAMLGHVERAIRFYRTSPSGEKRPAAVPDRFLKVLLGKARHEAPVVAGLVAHPIVLPSGEILACDGLHASSGLFLQNATIAEARPYTQAEAAQALARLRWNLLQEFVFAQPLDMDVAMAGLFTGVQRRAIVEGAPGLAILAAEQFSGKTTLARRIHITLTGHDMPAVVFPLGNEAEVSKMLLAVLMAGPEMLVFDNLADGATFQSPSIAAAMTSPAIEQRILGVTEMGNPPTNALFVLTGNNIQLGSDEASRWMVCRLLPKAARQEQRQYQNADVVTHARRVRTDVLRDVIGVVAGYRLSGAAIAPASRFPAWDRFVRQPLIWAGAADVAAVFRANNAESPKLRAHKVLASALLDRFGLQPFKAGDVAPLVLGDADLHEALAILVTQKGGPGSATAIGYMLKSLRDRIVEVGGRLMKITDAGDDRGANRYALCPIE